MTFRHISCRAADGNPTEVVVNEKVLSPFMMTARIQAQFCTLCSRGSLYDYDDGGARSHLAKIDQLLQPPPLKLNIKGERKL